jgi:predicted aminopeptidase
MRIKRILLLLLAGIAFFLLINIKSLVYGLGQLAGQVEILRDARELNEVLEDPAFPDSLKAKIRVVEEIKSYAVEELGLEPTRNYSTLYDQKGEDILWIVTACKPFELKAYEWRFPMFGTFPYKGYFDLKKAQQEEQKFIEKGYDTRLRSVSGWSTLGWFRDPILSNMLYRTEGDLANTIIHELTHQTLFIKDEVDLNENLATFVGDYGAMAYLENKYGTQHALFQSYLSDLRQEKDFKEYIMQGTTELQDLYFLMDSLDWDVNKKTKEKESFIRSWVEGIDTVELPGYRNFKLKYSRTLPNNAFFMGYLRYNKMQNEFETEFRTEYKENLGRYLDDLFKRYRRKENWYDF